MLENIGGGELPVVIVASVYEHFGLASGARFIGRETGLILGAVVVVDCCVLSCMLDGGVAVIICIQHSLCSLLDGNHYKEHILMAD